MACAQQQTYWMRIELLFIWIYSKEINEKNKNLNFDISQKLIIGGVGIRAGGLDFFSKINNRGGDDYSLLKSTEKCQIHPFSAHKRTKFLMCCQIHPFFQTQNVKTIGHTPFSLKQNSIFVRYTLLCYSS